MQDTGQSVNFNWNEIGYSKFQLDTENWKLKGQQTINYRHYILR